MSTRNLLERDKKELVKFKKYLVIKSLQVILQSRSGRKIVSQSKLISSGSDWFNLSVRDDIKVIDEIKKVYLNFGPHGLQCDSKSICLEFFFENYASENMTIHNKDSFEIWRISMSNVRDDYVRVMFGVYNRMSTLIKCLFSVSRVIPTYYLCRNLNLLQNLNINYKIYCKRFEAEDEKCFLRSFVGHVPTPEGTIIVDVLYKKNIKGVSKNLKAEDLLTSFNENYYFTEIPFINKDDNNEDITKGIEIVSFSDLNDNTNLKISSDNIVSVVKEDNGDVVIKGKFNNKTVDIPFEEYIENDYEGKQCKPNLNTKEYLEKEKKETNKTMIDSKNETLNKSLLKSDSELGDFYWDSSTAPSLNLLIQMPLETKDVFEDLSSKLAEFEASAKQFDAFVNSIHGLTFD